MSIGDDQFIRMHEMGKQEPIDVPIPPWSNPSKNEPRLLYNKRELLDVNVTVKFADPDLYKRAMSGRIEKAMTTDDILDSLSDLMENARKKKDEAEDGETARKWAIMVTELEKLYAWYFTFLFGS